ncbi:MAG TPA: AraC family transcriptional regulator [Flavobacteriales bacterium]|nr:AraC family transcriptional regulator [Flavobacteriales bacterium]
MQEEYIKRINKVLTYIDEHLEADLSLEKVSAIAFYSPFHLHRLFKAITNETLNTYITRKRIERTALMLIHHKEYSIAQIAEKYGFKNDSTYSRTFKKLYNQSPSAFRKSNLNNFSKIGKENSNKHQQDFITQEYLCTIEQLKTWLKMNATVEIKELPNMYLAYTTHIGVNNLESTFKRVVQWANPKGILNHADTHVCRVFHDSFKITDADKVRMSIGVISPTELEADAEMNLSNMEKGRCIVARFHIAPQDFEQSWNSVFIWMSEQGYKKADRSPFEIYHGAMGIASDGKLEVDLCIPIE